MRSIISTLATVAAGLFASTVSAQGKVAIYWGQGAYQKELSVVCKDSSVDIVNIAFVNGFPKDRNTYPDTNFGNACGGEYYQNPDGTTSKLLASCGIIETGITECRKNGKKVLLSLGGGYPTDYYIASDDAAKWLAEVLVGSFGPKTNEKWPRPFGASFVDGFDLDIESASAVGSQKFQYYAELVNYIKALSPSMLISSAPQCVVPDAHLDDAIARAPFDYIFTQFYNTEECSAKLGWTQRNQKETGFTFDKWTARLQQRSKNQNVKLFMGLPAGPAGANPNHYLTPEQANDLVVKYRNTPLWGGVMLWEATVSQNNVIYGQGYSNWIKYSLDGTFKEKYHPVVSSTIRSSSTLVSSTRSSTVTSKTSTPAPSKTSTPTPSKTSTVTPSKSSTPVISSSSTAKSSSSVAPSSSSTVKSSSSVAPSSSSVAPSSSSVAPSSSSVAPSSSSVTPSSSSVASSSVHVPSSSSVPVDVSSTVEHSATSSSVAPSETSSVEYSDYFSTAIPTHYSSSSIATAEPSTVYPEDVSSTIVHSSSSADVTSSASSTYEASSSADVTSSASSTYEASSSADVTSSASSTYEASSTPAASSSASEYYTDASSSTTPIGASSTPCTTSTELYPTSSKTSEASSATDYSFYSETSKTPEASSSEYSAESTKTPEASTSVEYSIESTKTPGVSTAYSASSSTSADASSTPCTTSTELYPTSSKTPKASSATDYSFYSETSKTPEASSSASEYSYYSKSSPVPDVSSKASEYETASTKTPVPTEYEFYSTVTPTVTKPAESTTTVVTTTYLDTCSTGLTTKTATITKTVCNACAKPSDKPEADYPSDWTTSVYVDKTLTITITKPIHPATDVPAYPTIVSEPSSPKPSAPAAEYPVDKEEVPSYETPAKSSSVPYEATKPSPKPEVPSAEKPSKPTYPEDVTVISSHYVTLTKVATPVAYTPVAYATPIVHQGYPVGNGTVPTGTGAVKPSATGTGKPVKPSSYVPPEFEGAASKLSMGMTGVVAVVAFLVL